MLKNSGLFRGWYVVGAVHVLLALIFGAAYSFGAFFASIQATFDAGRFSTASIFSLTALIYYVVGVFSGAWSDKTSVRTVTGVGIVLLALGFLASSLLSSSLTLFLSALCVLVGVGVGLVYVPAVSTVQRWFVLHRSSASGIALAGTGLGTLIGPIVAGALMRHLSWQSTMQVYAAAIALPGLAAAASLRGRPEDLGLHADGIARGRCEARRYRASICAKQPGMRASGGTSAPFSWAPSACSSRSFTSTPTRGSRGCRSLRRTCSSA